MFSPAEIRRGRILASGYFYLQYEKSDKEWDDKVLLALQVAGVWGADKVSWAFVYRAGVFASQRALYAAFATPHGLAISIPVIGGGIISYMIDEETGVANYADFLEDVVTKDVGSVVDKLTFTWDVLALKKGRRGGGGDWQWYAAQKIRNKLVQIKTDRYLARKQWKETNITTIGFEGR